MLSTADRGVSPVDHHLGWQGWQIDLPGEWNPARLGGNARSGTVIVADLERPRLELTWRGVRSPGRVDLSRVARSGKSTPLTWRPLAETGTGDGITDGRRAVADNGDVLALLLSATSNRLLFVKIAGGPGGSADPIADQLLASIADASDAVRVPWCVYEFAWSVPAGFQLWHHRFAAGRATLSFRRRRQSLTFERWALAGAGSAEATNDTDTGGKATGASSGGCLEHNGHKIQMVRVAGRKLWDRIVGGEGWRAQWTCQASNRGYRIEAAGPEAAHLLETGIRGVDCHRAAAAGRAG